MPFPTRGDLPNSGIEFTSLLSPALAGGFFTSEPPGKHPHIIVYHKIIYCQLMIGTMKKNKAEEWDLDNGRWEMGYFPQFRRSFLRRGHLSREWHAARVAAMWACGGKSIPGSGSASAKALRWEQGWRV